MSAGALAGFGTVMGAISASQERDAYKRASAQMMANADMQFNRMRGIADPFLNASRAGMQQAQDLAGWYGGRLGQESPLLNSQLGMTLQDINIATRRALEQSGQFWAGGNMGRGRGEALRTNLAATQATNQARLSFGQAQTQYISQNAQQYASLLGQLGNFGQVGANLMGYAGKNYMDSMDAAYKVQGQGDAYGAEIWSMFGQPMAQMGMLQIGKNPSGFVNSLKGIERLWTAPTRKTTGGTVAQTGTYTGSNSAARPMW